MNMALKSGLGAEGAYKDLLGLLVLALIVMAALAFGYAAQDYPSLPAGEAEIPALIGLRLGGGLLVALAAFAYFLRSDRNRKITKHALTE
jgi:hypothetical protein